MELLHLKVDRQLEQGQLVLRVVGVEKEPELVVWVELWEVL